MPLLGLFVVGLGLGLLKDGDARLETLADRVENEGQLESQLVGDITGVDSC